MFSTIIVPLDRSAFAESALPYAIEVARATGAAVRLALVHFPVWGTAEDVPTAIYDEAEADIRRSESRYLDELAGEIETRTGLDVRPQMLEGPIVPALREFTEASGGDIVVMSTHGHGGLKRAWLGSVTDGLLRHVTVPMLIVRPRDDWVTGASHERADAAGHGATAAVPGTDDGSDHGSRPAFEPLGPEGLTHTLIAVDGSTIANEAARRAGDLAVRCNARVTLLRVVRPPLHLTSAYLPHIVRLNRDELEQREAVATEHLHRLGSELRANGAQVAERVVIDYHAADAILREAADLGADLIAVGTHGRGGVRRLVIGSVAD
ncbi:MAG: universal stress protein, partial [Longimicrobiales bacterium]